MKVVFWRSTLGTADGGSLSILKICSAPDNELISFVSLGGGISCVEFSQDAITFRNWLIQKFS